MRKSASIIFGLFVVTLVFFVPVAYSTTPDNGAFGGYLVGTFDLRESHTVVQIVNPTPSAEGVCIALFDANGGALGGKNYKIASNGLIEVDIKALGPKANFGVVKVVVNKPSSISGVAGFQRFYSGKIGLAIESNLASIPLDTVKEEYEKIMAVCRR